MVYELNVWKEITGPRVIRKEDVLSNTMTKEKNVPQQHDAKMDWKWYLGVHAECGMFGGGDW